MKAGAPLPPLPPQKTFSPKHNLMVLDSYDGEAPPLFWETFPKNHRTTPSSLINADLLRKLAFETGFPDRTLIETIANDIKSGARIGCTGVYRSPTTASNAPSAIQNGERVSDAIASWVSKGFAYGPVDPEDTPAEAKFSGLMAREKPDGAVRVILNLSAPKGLSVNDGIDTSFFPTSMASTTQWLRVLNKTGRGSFMVKVDWASAYKHVPVHPADTDLQWFSWLGRNFKETSLVFGGASSAGIYDRLAKLVLHIVVQKAGFPPDLVCQYLDDCCAASSSYADIVRYDATFAQVAGLLGVELAPRSDPDKSFGPSKQGVVLGVWYDTVNWLWAIPSEKFIRLLHDLHHLLDNDSAPLDFMQRVLGKLIHVAPLVPAGKFNLLHVIKAASAAKDAKQLVPVSAALKRQLWFWLTVLRACNGKVAIPDPDARLPAWAWDIYTDAAGGSLDGSGRGVGAVSTFGWVQLPWGHKINSGADTGDGRKFDRVMSALELFGPLLALGAGARHLQGRPARFWVDNAASVYIYNKGYSTSCPISAALAAAIAQVAAFLGCRIEVLKITRCSNAWASMADALSKGAFGRFRALADSDGLGPLPRLPLAVPPPLLEWAAAPSADWELGEKLVAWLQGLGLGLQPLA